MCTRQRYLVLCAGKLLNTDKIYHKIATIVSHIDNFNIFFQQNVDCNSLKPQPNPFYKQIIKHWNTIPDRNLTPNEILNESITHNRNITIDGNYVDIKALKQGKITIVKDLLDEKFSLKSFNNLKQNGVNITQLEYNSLISSIPKDWLRKLKTYSGHFSLIEKGSIRLNNKYKHISLVKNKEFYHKFIIRKHVRPTALYKWEEQYYFENFDWEQIFQNPYRHISDTKLQSLQYQIIHRYFPCKYNVSRWYNTTDENCDICSNSAKQDTIEHYFYECDSVKNMWGDFIRWFQTATQISFPLRCLDILLGVSNDNNDQCINALNFCILFGKAFINRQKFKQEDITHEKFLRKLSNRLESEKYIAMVNNRYEQFDETFGAVHSQCLEDGLRTNKYLKA